MKVAFVDLKAQYETIKEEINTIIQEVIDNSSFIGGKYLERFERNFAQFIGVKHCIGVGNGTDALFVALKALGIGNGDEVITAANSFIATSEAISMTGAKPVFVDCERKYYDIDPELIAGAITSQTKAIIPVHLYGQPADMDPILEIAKKNNLLVVEDAAQAHGAEYGGRKAGTMGKFACFSFFPGKNLGAYGDGGALVTNDDTLAEKGRMFANHGRKEKYNHEFEGVNSRLDSLQAAILDVKLGYLEKWNQRRQEIAAKYNRELKNWVVTPEVRPGSKHVYHLYVVRLPRRSEMQNKLAEQGIATGIHYPISLPFLKAYESRGYKKEEFPVSQHFKDEILSLPIHGDMKNTEIQYVIEKLKGALQSIPGGKQ